MGLAGGGECLIEYTSEHSNDDEDDDDMWLCVRTYVHAFMHTVHILHVCPVGVCL